MLDLLDRFIIREFVASLPAGERALAELLMAGHSQTSAARELRITGRLVRYRVRRIGRGFSFDFPASGRDAAGGLDNTHDW